VTIFNSILNGNQISDNLNQFVQEEFIWLSTELKKVSTKSMAKIQLRIQELLRDSIKLYPIIRKNVCLELGLILYLEENLQVSKLDHSQSTQAGRDENGQLVRLMKQLDSIFSDSGVLLQFLSEPIRTVSRELSPVSDDSRGSFVSKQCIQLQNIQSSLRETQELMNLIMYSVCDRLEQLWQTIFALQDTPLVYKLKEIMIEFYTKFIVEALQDKDSLHLLAALQQITECVFKLPPAFANDIQLRSELSMLTLPPAEGYEVSSFNELYSIVDNIFKHPDSTLRIQALKSSINREEIDDTDLCIVVCCHTQFGKVPTIMDTYLRQLISAKPPISYCSPSSFTFIENHHIVLLLEYIIVDIETQSQSEITEIFKQYETSSYHTLRKGNVRVVEQSYCIFEQWKQEKHKVELLEFTRERNSTLSTIVNRMNTDTNWIYIENKWIKDERRSDTKWIWDSSINRWTLTVPENTAEKFSADTMKQYCDSITPKTNNREDSITWKHISQHGYVCQ
jgi:hypothetical protein